MPRIRKDAAVRRKEILDTAQRLIYTKGYEPMTIQDIVDELQISKGGFFHHFDSKQALLDALIERMRTEVEPLMLTIVNDAKMPALEKFQRFFATGSQWRTEHRSQLLPLLHVWFSDKNVLTRRRMHLARSRIASPMFAAIIRQGIQEGVFATPYPDQAAGVIYTLMKSLDEKVVDLLLVPQLESEKLSQILSLQAAYVDIFERILGAPSGSLQQGNPEMLNRWLSDLPANIPLEGDTQ
jgi:AcrR family transcriptional regulator